VYASVDLHSIYISLLSHPERTLQTVAVDCLLSYKSKALKTHESTIRGLLDDSQWKDHLMGLDLAGTVEPSHRVEYVDFLVRLLYGMIRERRGRNKLQDRRATLLGALRQCADEELGTLVRLMLEPFGMTENQSTFAEFGAHRQPASLTWKQQVGFLVLQGEVIRLLGLKLTKYWPSLLWATMSVTATAQRILEDVKMRHDDQPLGDAETDGDAASDTGGTEIPHKIARNLRQLGIKRFTEYFRPAVEFDFTPYLSVAFKTFISPRLEALEMENTQSPSAIMELFHAWSARPSQVEFLVNYDHRVLPKIFACLVATNVKPSVVSRVLDIVENVFTAAGSNEDLIERFIRPHLSLLIDHLAVMIKEADCTSTTPPEILQRQIHTLRIISDYVVDGQHASSLLPLLLPLLRKPADKVNETVKVDLLRVVYRLLSLLAADDSQTVVLSTTVYEIVSHLLQTLRGRQARLSAAEVFTALASKDSGLEQLAISIKNLNSFDENRPEEPDFDRRMDAFTTLNERLYLQLTPPQWLPILHNMLHFIHDRNELSIRNNAAYSMRRFIQMVGSNPSEEWQKLFTRVLLTGLKHGLRSKYELVRTELISVIAFAVKTCPDLPSLYDMTPLLADGDEEANFFNNISHVQSHRRARALRRLSDNCDQGHLRSSTLNEVFVPIVGHYIGDSSIDHLLVNEAISTMGHIAKQLIWSRYYALVQRYLKLVQEKSPVVKFYVRTVISLLDNFHFSMGEVVQVPQQEEEVPEEAEGNSVPESKPSLSLKIADAVNGRLLPALLRFLEKREETEDTMRIPMAVGIAKVALHLPEEEQRLQVTRLMTILSQALRSKSSETRDLTRETLCKVVISSGSPYLPTLIQELRVALTHGPQLHVLAVTCHSLAHYLTTPDAIERGFTCLDDVASDIAEISAEVIFGQSGKDVQGEDFKTTFREVRSSSSKALDTLTILARSIKPGCVARLLLPLRSIMHETESVKTMQLVEESLKRIASGLNSNPSLDPTALLSLCHTLIGQNAKFLQEKPDIRRTGSRVRNSFVVQSKRDLPRASEHYAHNSFRFIAFGLDLLVVAFRRNRFNYQDADIISRLEPMVNLIGNTLYSNAASVVVLGLKAVSAIVRAPLQAIPKSLPVIVHQQVEIIRQAGSAESEVAQASLKSLASTLRDCTMAQLKEKDLKFILEVMAPDLEEAERQAAVFALLRAIIQRKLVVPEIYDMLDRVATVVVTNQSIQVQEMCRGILLQFLLDYPQGKGRLRKQMTFLASNLSYVFESGRLSVMTLLDALFQKFEQKLVAEYADMYFVALVMVLANDDSSACRERASTLIKVLYKALERDQRLQIMQRLHVWVTQGAQGSLTCVAAQVYGLIIDVSSEDGRTHLPAILSDLNQVLDSTVEHQAELGELAEDSMEVDLDWQTPYHAVIVLCKAYKSLHDVDAISNGVSWSAIIDLMLFPHAWVRSACSKLLGSFYANPVNCVVESDPGTLHPATRLGMVAVAKNSSIQLRSEHLDQGFTLQIVKILVYVGKAFHRQSVNGREADEQNESHENSVGSSSEAEAEREQKTKEERILQAPLPWLFSKLSYQVKTAHLKRRNSFVAPVRKFSYVFLVHS
jgi:U3 small nucleolar RNA-associated protein 20